MGLVPEAAATLGGRVAWAESSLDTTLVDLSDNLQVHVYRSSPFAPSLTSSCEESSSDAKSQSEQEADT
jgi:hypothetical protein